MEYLFLFSRGYYMQRYFLNQQNQFKSDDVHHIINVMRFKTGVQVEVCKLEGCFLATLEIENQSVSYKLIQLLSDNPPLNITIIQGLPKGDKIDLVTKYATLFQAQGIIFMPMVRSIAKLSNIEHKLGRLNKIAKEAAELSKRSTLPKIQFIENLNTLDLTNKTLILLDELESSYTLKDLYDTNDTNEVYVIIGPEGGIDFKERQSFIDLGAKPLSLGQSILPTELAHIPILNAFLLKKV